MGTKNTYVGLKELRENMEGYITRVRGGESITVLRRNVPVFTITPPETFEEKQWETVIDFTELSEEGVSARDVLKAIKRVHG